VLATFVDNSVKELQLSPAVDRLWRQAWRTLRRLADAKRIMLIPKPSRIA
jgi:hypothetical protein